MKNFTISPLIEICLCISISFLLIQSTHGQNCDHLKKQHLPASFIDNIFEHRSTNEPLWKLLKCGFDSTDIELLSLTPFLSIVMYGSMKEPEEVTYGDIIDQFENLRLHLYYDTIKMNFVKVKRVMDLPANIETWTFVKTILKEIEENDYFLNWIEKTMGQPEFATRTITYADIFRTINLETAFDVMINAPSETHPIVKLPLEWKYKNIPLDEAKAISKEAGLPLILYFTGYGNVNAAKMEAHLLSQPDVQMFLLNAYIVIALYVDDLTPLHNERETVGSVNSKLQVSLAQSNMQPLFVKLNEEGDIINRIGYVTSKELFMQFLYENE